MTTCDRGPWVTAGTGVPSRAIPLAFGGDEELHVPTSLPMAPPPLLEPDMARQRRTNMRSGIALLAFLAAVTGCASGTVTQPTGNPHTTLPAAAISVQVMLPSRTMPAGSHMSGRVLVDNRTGHAIHLHGCRSLFEVALVSSTYHPDVTTATCTQVFTIPVGKSSYAETVLATYLACNAGGPRGGLPACLPGKQKLPPLPPGNYHATLFFHVRQFASAPPAIPVPVTHN